MSTRQRRGRSHDRNNLTDKPGAGTHAYGAAASFDELVPEHLKMHTRVSS